MRRALARRRRRAVLPHPEDITDRDVEPYRNRSQRKEERMRRRTAWLGLAGVVIFSLSARAQDARPRPKTYGISQDSIYHVSITDFVPWRSGYGTKDESFIGALARHAASCSGTCLYAIPRLPNGALLTGIEAYFCNSNPDSGRVLGIELYKTWYDGSNAQYLGPGPYSATHNGCGEFAIMDLTSLNFQVNYYDNQFYLLANIDSDDGSQAIAGVNLFYRLQVSPAPPTADFGDVPTNHPYFQFIEALSGSGITAGCGNGDYCPDRPITRGEMAVFLAKALGLQWP
jgi:S-layer family protein